MKLILGTANFYHEYGINGVQLGHSEIDRILDTARAVGIEYIDTAPAYLNRWNEWDMLHVPDFTGFKMIQKTPWQGKAWALLQHDPDGSLGPPARAKYLGYVKKYGISVYTPEQMMKAIRYPIDIIQVPCNIADNRFIPYLPELKKRGIEVHARSVFLQGALLEGKFDFRTFTVQECLGFVLAQDFDGVIVGVNTAEQLQELVKVKPDEMEGLNICDDRIRPDKWG
jgi:aryl-alcohol dehydrogenase-like predicted oxidoreductase